MNEFRVGDGRYPHEDENRMDPPHDPMQSAPTFASRPEKTKESTEPMGENPCHLSPATPMRIPSTPNPVITIIASNRSAHVSAKVVSRVSGRLT